MTVWALIPAKDPARAKSRLSRALSPRSRHAFALRTLRHVVDVALATPAIDRCLVISSAQEALEVAAAAGAVAVRELPSEARQPRGAQRPEGSGRAESALNRALELGAQLALRGGASAVLVMAADLPLVDQASITELVSRLVGPRGLVLAPDRHGSGTNALLVRPPKAVPFAFGPHSLRRHYLLALERGLEVSVCSLERLALDIDTLEDVHAFADSLRRAGMPPAEHRRWFGLDGDACCESKLADSGPGARVSPDAEIRKERCAHGA